MKKQNRRNNYPLIVVLLLLALAYSCNNDPDIPILSTAPLSNPTLTSATTGGNIIDEGGSSVTARGICWSKGETPTINSSKTTDGNGLGSFVSHITGLTPFTVYYARAYATNDEGTAYGNTIILMKTETILAGIYDSTFIYHEYLSPITLNIQMESNMLVANATENIQLQFDNESMELLVYMKIMNPDSQQVINQNDDFIPFKLDIASNDTASFHLTELLYYVGQGNVAHFDFITAFSKNEIISNNSRWSMLPFSSAPRWFSMWNYPVHIPGPIFGFDGGTWYDTDSPVKYIGFNYKGRLGWIEVDITERTDPKFISYAIKK